MNFTYADGPVASNKSVDQIVSSLQEIEKKRFMSLARRLGTSSAGAGQFQAFKPDPTDDPFHTGPAPDRQVGFRAGLSVTNSMNMSFSQGYEVVFSVFDRGSNREVSVNVRGSGMRSETQKLVKQAFELL